MKKALKIAGITLLIIALLPLAVVAALVWVIATLCKLAARTSKTARDNELL